MAVEVQDEIIEAIRDVTRASAELSRDIVVFADATLQANTTNPNYGEEFFEALWEVLDYAGMVWNRSAHGHYALMQVLENLTRHVTREPAWQSVDKGTHFFNLGLVHIANGHVDNAFRYFLLADEEGQRTASTNPGDLFRSHRLFAGLRTRFFGSWLGSGSNFNDGLSDADRLQVVERLVSAIPDLYLLGRCHLGLFRTCLIYHQQRSDVRQPTGSYLHAIEDLAVLAEASAKRLHFGGTFQSGAVFGDMFRGSSAVGMLGFDNNHYPKFDIANQADTQQAIVDARAGDRGAMARVVGCFRNTSSHAHPFPHWTLTAALLWDVVLVLLDFITTISAEVENRYPPPP